MTSPSFKVQREINRWRFTSGKYSSSYQPFVVMLGSNRIASLDTLYGVRNHVLLPINTCRKPGPLCQNKNQV